MVEPCGALNGGHGVPRSSLSTIWSSPRMERPPLSPKPAIVGARARAGDEDLASGAALAPSHDCKGKPSPSTPLRRAINSARRIFAELAERYAAAFKYTGRGILAKRSTVFESCRRFQSQLVSWPMAAPSLRLNLPVDWQGIPNAPMFVAYAT